MSSTDQKKLLNDVPEERDLCMFLQLLVGVEQVVNCAITWKT